MKQYPSIGHAGTAPRDFCYVFAKLDGSNIRAEWSKKRGWYKFGTRKTLFDETHPIWGSAITLFKERYGDALPRVFTTSKEFRGIDNVTVFCEWFGAKSFAGYHVKDDPKTILLFDVNPLKKGFLGPKRFLNEFGHLEIADHFYTGNLNDELIAKVRSGEFDVKSSHPIANELPEGVICKGGDGHKIWMCKIKTQAYYNALKERLPENWTDFWE